MTSCSPTARRNISAVATGAAQGAAGDSNSESAAVKLMVFGGADHRTYLGCLNCSQFAVDSVLNEYGQHGSRYSSESIWNHYGDLVLSSSCFIESVSEIVLSAKEISMVFVMQTPLEEVAMMPCLSHLTT